MRYGTGDSGAFYFEILIVYAIFPLSCVWLSAAWNSSLIVNHMRLIFWVLLYWRLLLFSFPLCRWQHSQSQLSEGTSEIRDIHRVPEKTSHFNFRHNFAICWDIFTIFEAPCSGIIAGWCNLLHTHHQCEAFTWRDVTHDVIQAVARRAHRHQISYHLTYGLWTHRT